MLDEIFGGSKKPRLGKKRVILPSVIKKELSEDIRKQINSHNAKIARKQKQRQKELSMAKLIGNTISKSMKPKKRPRRRRY